MMKKNCKRQRYLLHQAVLVSLVIFACFLLGCGRKRVTFLEPEDASASWAPESLRVTFVCTRRQWTTEWHSDTPYLGPYSGLDAYQLLEICTSDIDGNNRRQLTDNLVQDYSPVWSPNSNQIAFVSCPSHSPKGDIYIMRADGTNLVNLTNRAASYGELHWSPDGHNIAFVSMQDDRNHDLYMIAVDDTQLVRLTQMDRVGSPNWSPDGKQIVFDAGVSDNVEIFVVDVEDGSLHQLTDNAVLDFEPVWSPDGRYIAFSSNRKDGTQVYTVDVQTYEETQISGGSEGGWGASWSPDGQFLAYVSGHRGGIDQDIYVLNLETGASMVFPTQLRDRPLWSPNSQYLIYERLEDWNGDGYEELKIFVLRIDDGTEWAVSSIEETD